MEKTNIVLIGMPSSGKSTIGKLIAQNKKLQFIDTDLLIRDKTNKSPKDIVTDEGLDTFLKIQEQIVKNLNVSNSVISTGGSIVYNDKAMNNLKKTGIIVFLKLKCSEIKKRISSGRRFARKKEQNLTDLYNERMPLYSKYADITIDCSGKTAEEITNIIVKLVT